MKTYQLEIETLHDLDSGGTVYYYSKGHHDIQSFCTELEREHDEVANSEKVKHKFMRWGTVYNDGEKCQQISYFYNSTGRGRFPITIVDADDTHFVDESLD